VLWVQASAFSAAQVIDQTKPKPCLKDGVFQKKKLKKKKQRKQKIKKK
jgi:hypothetical protein